MRVFFWPPVAQAADHAGVGPQMGRHPTLGKKILMRGGGWIGRYSPPIAPHAVAPAVIA